MVGMIVARQSCRKRNITSTTSAIASSSVLSTSRIESEMTVVLSKATSYLRPGGKLFEQALELGAHTVVDVEGVGRRQLRHADADRVASVEPEAARVRLGSDLGAADVARGARGCRRCSSG